MLNPSEIEQRDFLVVVHGYHKAEVREFLAEVATQQAALQTEIDRLNARPEVDEFSALGSSVAGVIRAAHDAAAEVVAAARAEAERIRDGAVAEAEALRAEAIKVAAEHRSTAELALAVARAEAERLEQEATERALELEIETEERLRNRFESVQRREAAIRTQLTVVADELRLALEAISETSIDAGRGTEERLFDASHG